VYLIEIYYTIPQGILALNNPVYKDLTLKIEAFRLLNPDMDESEAQQRISKIVKEHVQDRKKK
jgi:hypothetical protein